ncbi:MAG: Rne/Rng family ribonuclease [Rickettsiales bacterium]|jgi:ribonuclease E|nr:Rne/Rng family ribonuclease [Rickettsiales bacterium]
MNKKVLIDGIFSDEKRVALIENDILQDYDREDVFFRQKRGDIYLAEVTRVEHSLQAAFVNYGGDRHGFLPFSDIHPDYLGIPDNLKKDLSALNFFNNVDTQRNKTGTVKEGQYLLVQVLKEERGEKGVALTTYITLASKYCILLCNVAKGGGISKKITDPSERKVLKEKLLKLNIPRNMSVILRTAVNEDENNSIEKDLSYLMRLWEYILTLAKNSKKPIFLHSEEDILKRAIRDIINTSVSEVIVEGEETFNSLKKSLSLFYKDEEIKLVKYSGAEPLFHKYNIENQINNLYNNRILLQSGVSLVIDQTEALITIDINSGGSNHDGDLENTALKTNLEAASEIGRQLKLRDLGGLVVIDFIDMEVEQHKREVEDAMRLATAHDRARIKIAKISQFGLLEMSRQRLNATQREKISKVCQYCGGSGKMKSVDLVSMNILREIKSIILNKEIEVVTISSTKDMIYHLSNFRKAELLNLENAYKVTIFLSVDESLVDNEYNVRKRKKLTHEEQDCLKHKQIMEVDSDIIDGIHPLIDDSSKKREQKTQVVKKNNNKMRKKESAWDSIKKFLRI